MGSWIDGFSGSQTVSEHALSDGLRIEADHAALVLRSNFIDPRSFNQDDAASRYEIRAKRMEPFFIKEDNPWPLNGLMHTSFYYKSQASLAKVTIY
jgi:hypothetical protein